MNFYDNEIVIHRLSFLLCVIIIYNEKNVATILAISLTDLAAFGLQYCTLFHLGRLTEIREYHQRLTVNKLISINCQ